ncbi:gamma-glutamyl-gamma-aminobutyrate hydrolase family protein [Nannocystis bainbridge]|uniref:Gamma-glutamyl-gamma-aminobutyrate hydrolase family protein n=1 Tax=Nannocystis bainbridge TaxID=2995303 RepID=A0ABT5E5M5_9BACT|nr:gamma-glutamyl-gamma-aminobutyrate hydrolase family protein [Nannocystis bainbridge]MDC0720710.1 gamma-glutamyl-gamma-aminobutyrate hydrolase family protein [Nannocystis bainbridge]
MRPVLIGLSCGTSYPDPGRALFLGKSLDYGEQRLSAALARAGALPFLLPVLPDTSMLVALVERVDALVLSGGSDVAPGVYGEAPLRPEWAGDPARDAYEQALLGAALAQGKPVLGVCRGIQLLNAALGGSLYQDIGFQVPGALVHRDPARYDDNEHPVRLLAESWLAALYGAPELLVNSVHHQAIKALAPGLRACAWAPDGIIEAAADERRDIYGVQWHPEWLDRESPHFARRCAGDPIFSAFVARVRVRAGVA